MSPRQTGNQITGRLNSLQRTLTTNPNPSVAAQRCRFRIDKLLDHQSCEIESQSRLS